MRSLNRVVIVLALIAGGVIGLPALTAEAACTRLPLSDVAFGRGPATESARQKLDEYARQIANKRGWPKNAKLVKSNETVSCKVYLSFGPFGTEYRCLVTATFCTKK